MESDLTKYSRSEVKYDHKTSKENIFHNSKAWWNILVGWTDEEIATFGNPEHAALIKETRKERVAIKEEMHAIYHDKDSKTHWNDYLRRKETVYKDIPYPCID